MADKPQHLLDGYKVLDFTQFLAGASAQPTVLHQDEHPERANAIPAGPARGIGS